MVIIINGKILNIFVCNVLDKVLIDINLLNWEVFVKQLVIELEKFKVIVLGDDVFVKVIGVFVIENDLIWYEEFLDYKIVIGIINLNQEVIVKINKYCGGYLVFVIIENKVLVQEFMDNVDVFLVYYNVLICFMDGG